MKTLALALVAALLTIPVLSEVPSGVDKKWDSTLTVQLKSTGSRTTINIRAIAPAGGDLIVKYGSGQYEWFKVPAGQTVTKIVQVSRQYTVTAKYNGRLLDTERWNKKTGLGGGGMTTKDSVGGLGDRKKVGR